MALNTAPDSSWIASIAYRRTPDKARYLAIFLKGKDGQEEETALLYGPTVKPWLPGLLKAGLGGRSIGRAFNRLMKGGKAQEMGLAYQRIEGREKVQALRRMMAS